MNQEKLSLEDIYNQKLNEAHQAFREGNLLRLANRLFQQAEITHILYKETGLEFWDMKSYGAYNAAGGAYESIKDYEAATFSYKMGLVSLERITTGRDQASWQKNIDHLKFLITHSERHLRIK